MARDKTLDEVVEYLFTNGAKQKGNRLILVDEDHRGSAVVSKARDLGGWGDLVIRDLLKDFAATVRKDAREAAFKESVAIIVGQPVAHYTYSGSQPMAAETFRDNCVKAIEATIAIEAARK